MVSSAAQRCLDGAGTHLRHGRYLLDAHLLQVEECDAGLLALAQHTDGAVQGRYLLSIIVGLHGQVLQGGCRVLIVETQVMLHSLEMVLIGGEGNAVHPRAERREPLVAVQSAPHTDEGLLREVIAQRLIATRLYEEVAAHRAQIPLHQSAECTPIVQEQHTGDKEYFFGGGHGEIIMNYEF